MATTTTFLPSDEGHAQQTTVPAEAAAAKPSRAFTAHPPAGVEGRRLLVILHGKRADELDVRQAIKAVRDDGVKVSVKVTWEAGDVDQFVRDAVRAGNVDTIVAAGGDGTVNEVVAALLKCKAPKEIAVGVLPVGTSNDFAAVTEIPSDLEDALRLCICNDTLHEVDVGLLNDGVFMNTCTVGATSELGSETSGEAKKALGPAAYLITGVQKLTSYHPVNCKLRYPAEGQDPRTPRNRQKVVETKEQLLNLTAGNNRQVASMLQICPDALLDDGLIDITYFVGTPAEAITTLASEVVGVGVGDGAAEGKDQIKMLRVPWIEVIADEALSANRDGEPVEPSTRYLIEAIPRRVLLHLPDEHLLRKAADRKQNPPVIKHNKKRRGVLHDMWAHVTRFQRIRPGTVPLWRRLAVNVLKVSACMALGYGLGFSAAVHRYKRRREMALQEA